MRPSPRHGRASGTARTVRSRRGRQRLGFVAVCLLLLAAVALAPAAVSAAGAGHGHHARRHKKKPRQLTKKQVIALIERYAGSGSAGPEGKPGPEGKAGAAAGGPGQTGATGEKGATGDTGPAGPQGPAGPAGSAVLSGSSAPTGGVGANGDFYIDTSSYEIYGPKAGGDWGSGTPLSAGGGEPTGPAGGALTGSYPNPTLKVSGGDEGEAACENGEALIGLSSGAELACGPGVYVGHENVGVGVHRLGGEYNTVSGGDALSADTTGYANTATGWQALRGNTEGLENTAGGEGALQENSTGNLNTASGASALRKNSTGGLNTANGADALLNNTSGGLNVAVGADALLNTTGDDNVAIGSGAGRSLTTGSDNIEIGNEGVAGEAKTIRIGEGQEKAFLAGVSEVNVGVNPDVVVTGDGQLGVSTSSRRFKRDIRPIGARAGRLMKLRPVSFRYKPEDVQGPNPTQYGLIAEQVAKTYPNLVVRRGGKPFTVLYQELPALLLAKVQQQQHQIDALRGQKRRLDRQQREIRWLMRRSRRAGGREHE